jgi:D-alanyl-D-alanine carboxypeptidase/D-alanyl-D-alanine-endopeptidase (penicillin-binding protein 4)
MGRIRLVSACFLLVLLATQMAAAAGKKPAKRPSLPERIDRILAELDVAHGFWGVQVVSLDTGKVLYAYNSDRLFTPASNTKLFTTAATLALIGPEYKFKTTVETTGLMDKYGRVNGDLLLVGRGDPNLSGRVLPYSGRTVRANPPLQVLENLADQLVQKGVKFVDGDLIADDSYFAFERYGEGWSQEDLVSQWGAPVSALTINDNVIFVNIQPADRPGEKAFVNVTPYAGYYRLNNRIMTTPAGTGPRNVTISRQPGSNELTMWGTIPLDDPGFSDAFAIEDPAEFAGQLFRELLQKRGIVVYGSTRVHHTELSSLSTFSVTTMAAIGGGDTPKPRSPNPPLVLASAESQPLMEDLRVINKVSQNLHAELMLRLLGREKGTAGTIEGGLEVVRGFLMQAGIRGDEYAFFDGSGMSRENLVTPAAIVKLLKFVAGQPWSASFRSTLPVAGVDGSMAERLKGTAAQGRVQAKTGSLGHVNALSGYVETVNGEQVVFSIMANNHNLGNRRAEAVMDRIVGAIVDDAPPPTTTPGKN